VKQSGSCAMPCRTQDPHWFQLQKEVGGLIDE
jgi:hypothetical protein